MCSEPTPPTGGVYITAGCNPYYQVETEQSLIILMIVVVVVVEYYCFIRIIIVGAGQARCPPFSYVLHHVLVWGIINFPFYTIKEGVLKTGAFVVGFFLTTVLQIQHLEILTQMFISEFSYFYTMFSQFLASSWLLLGPLGGSGPSGGPF